MGNRASRHHGFIAASVGALAIFALAGRAEAVPHMGAELEFWYKLTRITNAAPTAYTDPHADALARFKQVAGTPDAPGFHISRLGVTYDLGGSSRTLELVTGPIDATSVAQTAAMTALTDFATAIETAAIAQDTPWPADLDADHHPAAFPANCDQAVRLTDVVERYNNGRHADWRLAIDDAADNMFVLRCNRGDARDVGDAQLNFEIALDAYASGRLGQDYAWGYAALARAKYNALTGAIAGSLGAIHGLADVANHAPVQAYFVFLRMLYYMDGELTPPHGGAVDEDDPEDRNHVVQKNRWGNLVKVRTDVLYNGIPGPQRQVVGDWIDAATQADLRSAVCGDAADAQRARCVAKFDGQANTPALRGACGVQGTNVPTANQSSCMAREVLRTSRHTHAPNPIPMQAFDGRAAIVVESRSEVLTVARGFHVVLDQGNHHWGFNQGHLDAAVDMVVHINTIP